jgi:hypothetical protein
MHFQSLLPWTSISRKIVLLRNGRHVQRALPLVGRERKRPLTPDIAPELGKPCLDLKKRERGTIMCVLGTCVCGTPHSPVHASAGRLSH